MKYKIGQHVKFKIVWFNPDRSVKKVSNIIEQGKIHSIDGEFYNIIVMDNHKKKFPNTGFGSYLSKDEYIL